MKDWLPDRAVLFMVAFGLLAVLLAIVIGIFNVPSVPADQQSIPNWAENVLVAVATGALLKVGDVIAAVVALATNRQVERLGTKLGDSTPPSPPPPTSAVDAANAVADAAQTEAANITGEPK